MNYHSNFQINVFADVNHKLKIRPFYQFFRFFILDSQQIQNILAIVCAFESKRLQFDSKMYYKTN